MKDHYKTLELNFLASAEEIKKAYRRLALKYHPDVNSSNSANILFNEISESYRVLSNPDLKIAYDQSHISKNVLPKEEEKSFTANDLFKILSETRARVVKNGRAKINETGLYNSINDLLGENNIKALISRDDRKTNKLIINEVLICCEYLEISVAEKLIAKLIRICGSDSETIILIDKSVKKLKRRDKISMYMARAKIVLFISFVIFIIYAVNSNDDNKTRSSATNRELDSDFTVKNQQNAASQKEQLDKKRQEYIANGYQEQTLDNGQFPECYNFKPKKGKTDNYLAIYVGGGTDVSIKVMDVTTEKCVRYIFINSGTDYRITNIPTGKYYLKIAYGRNWFSKIDNNRCVGKFLKNPIYEKGEDILDYNLQYKSGGYSVPSFELKLDVIQNDVNKSFNSQDISEDEFNN